MAAADEEPSTAASAVEPAVPCRGCGCADRNDAHAEAVPEWRRSAEAKPAGRIDVRPMLAAGEPPLGAVLGTAEAVAPGGILIIEAPFDPQPLRRVLAAKGFSTYGERLAAGHWRIWCRRGDGVGEAPARAADPTQAGPRSWRDGEVVHIDVRGLEAPRPLVAILALIDGGGHTGHVVVHHDREPLYLYPELEERGWRYARLASPQGEVHLELRGPR